MTKTNNTHAPFRADYVGSFLRPEPLKAARAKWVDGQITDQELHNVEDACIAHLAEQQIAAGYHVITDGEFRRSYWHLDFMWGLENVRHIEQEHGYQFHGEETTRGSLKLTGKLGGHNHPFVKHYTFVKQFEKEGVVAKQTIPAPAQFYAELFRGDNALNTQHFYPDNEELIQDIASAYRQVIKDLYDAGCRNLQFDDCTWGMVCDTEFWEKMVGSAYDGQQLQESYLRVNNLAIEEHPADMVINTHVCRGNYHSTWASKGAYDSVAAKLFARENVDAFYLEYDDERSGGFEPLALVPENKKVVLGLITTKRPELEDKAAVKARIAEATKYIPLDRLCLSPQCGFASCEIGNKLTEA